MLEIQQVLKWKENLWYIADSTLETGKISAVFHSIIKGNGIIFRVK
jgi:hypothetical protein